MPIWLSPGGRAERADQTAFATACRAPRPTWRRSGQGISLTSPDARICHLTRPSHGSRVTDEVVGVGRPDNCLRTRQLSLAISVAPPASPLVGRRRSRKSYCAQWPNSDGPLTGHKGRR